MQLEDLTTHDLGLGIGLRTKHFAYVIEHWPELDWFEILSENFMDSGGRPLHFLDQIAERYPIVMHGVSMNLGSKDPLDMDYMRELKRLRDRCGARFVSDHICWTGIDGTNLHDLLPLPYTEEALAVMGNKVRQAQDFLEAPMVLENPSTYLEFAHSQMSETEFLGRLAQDTGCGFLMDVNNVYVCAKNHGFDPAEYLAQVPWDHVVQFHVAGHSDLGTHLLDTHDGPVCEDVWDLYRIAHESSGGRSTLMEWDAKIPDFEAIRAEALKARDIRSESERSASEQSVQEATTTHG